MNSKENIQLIDLFNEIFVSYVDENVIFFILTTIFFFFITIFSKKSQPISFWNYKFLPTIIKFTFKGTLRKFIFFPTPTENIKIIDLIIIKQHLIRNILLLKNNLHQKNTFLRLHELKLCLEPLRASSSQNFIPQNYLQYLH